jgi:hypothetical protein
MINQSLTKVVPAWVDMNSEARDALEDPIGTKLMRQFGQFSKKTQMLC